jgi:putative sugar O-methyltransferase
MSTIVSNQKISQVPDDVELLDLMLADHSKQSQLYGTTNYYRTYDRESIPYLRDIGLTDYRTKAPLSIASFAAVDSKLHPDDAAIRRLMYYHAERYGYNSSARPLSEVQISRCGNPEDYFEFGNRGLTPQSLRYYMRYGYVGRFLDWNVIKVVAELEIIGQLHSDVALLLFDIPPQLYVCESYLRAVFGGRVVSYRENRHVTRGFLPEASKIYIFGNWQMGILRQMKFDLFWSAACLCATEPEVAKNYLTIVNDSLAPAAYLMENFEGLVTAPPGQHGVIRKTMMEHYRKGLLQFELIDKSPHHFEDSSLADYDNSFWRRKSGLTKHQALEQRQGNLRRLREFVGGAFKRPL